MRGSLGTRMWLCGYSKTGTHRILHERVWIIFTKCYLIVWSHGSWFILATRVSVLHSLRRILWDLSEDSRIRDSARQFGRTRGRYRRSDSRRVTACRGWALKRVHYCPPPRGGGHSLRPVHLTIHISDLISKIFVTCSCVGLWYKRNLFTSKSSVFCRMLHMAHVLFAPASLLGNETANLWLYKESEPISKGFWLVPWLHCVKCDLRFSRRWLWRWLSSGL
jgi:hypothetical protein